MISRKMPLFVRVIQFFLVLYLFNIFMVLPCFADEVFTVGAICSPSSDCQDQTFSDRQVVVNITCFYSNTSSVFNVYSAVRVFDTSEVDIIILLDVTAAVLWNRHVLLNATTKPIIVWSEIDTNYPSQVDVRKNPRFYSEDIICDASSEPEIIKNRVVPVLRTLFNPASVIGALVQELTIKYVIIVYEPATVLELSAVLDELSSRLVLYALYSIDEIVKLRTDIKTFYNNLSGFSQRREDKIDFLVLCRHECVDTILHEANEFDQKYNANKTVLRNLSRWTVALYGRADYNNITSCSFDVDNVLVVPIPEVVFDKSPLLVGALHAALMKVTCNITSSSDAEIQRWKSRYIENIKQASRDVTLASHCDLYKIETLAWTPNGREFETVGFVKQDGNIVLKSRLFPNAKYGYNKREFHVSVIEYPPFVVKEVLADGTARFTGYCLDILENLAQVLNFTYRITEVPDGNYGIVINRKTMEFNGLIGQVQRSEVDMIVADIAITRDREQVIDFTYPFYYGYTTVILKRPNLDQLKWRKLVDPLKWQVVVLIAGTLIVASLIVYILEKSNPFYIRKIDTGSEKHNCRKLGCGVQTFIGSVSCLFASLFNEGNLHMPRSTTGRTFLSGWSLFCMIIAATYSGNLVAFLTVTKEKIPFDSLKEMAKMDGTYEWGAIGGTIWEQTFMEAHIDIYKSIGDSMRRFNKSDPTILHKNPAFHVKRVEENDNYAFIADDATVDIAIATNCDIIKIKERFLPLTNAFGFPDKSPHTKIFSEQLMAMHESGLMEIWKRKWWPSAEICSEKLRPEAKPIALIDVQSAFYIALIGLFCGLISFIVERMVYHWRQRTRYVEEHDKE